MTAIADILGAATRGDGTLTVTIPADWMQGRTTYGGLSSALALHAAKTVEPDLPPLRSVLVAFVGPLAGTVHVTATRLRRGRNAAFVEVGITSDAGLGLRATFVFMSDVASKIAYDVTAPSPHVPPAADAKLYVGPAEFFTGNFESTDLKAHAGEGEWLRWTRLRERERLDPEVELMAVADALPPAALQLIGGIAPVSSLTWIVNILRPRAVSRDGWWLMHTRTERAIGGYSSQRMTMWDADGVPVVDAMQGVAVFA